MKIWIYRDHFKGFRRVAKDDKRLDWNRTLVEGSNRVWFKGREKYGAYVSWGETREACAEMVNYHVRQRIADAELQIAQTQKTIAGLQASLVIP